MKKFLHKNDLSVVLAALFLAIVVLGIFLRQEGSPESKDIHDPNSKTGA